MQQDNVIIIHNLRTFEEKIVLSNTYNIPLLYKTVQQIDMTLKNRQSLIPLISL
jgi:hypothetical protein